MWLKEIGPTNKLRKWFGHDPVKWAEFKKKYLHELKNNEAIKKLRDLQKRNKKITLLYGAKDEKHNQAVVIKELLDE